MATHIFIYHDTTADSYGGARFNNLAFYDKNNNKIPVTDIKRGSGNLVEFKINGVSGRVEIISPYSDSSYPLINVFETETGNSNATMTTTKKTMNIYFDENIKNISYVTLLSTHALANDWYIEVDGKLVNSDPIKTTLDKVFSLPMPIEVDGKLANSDPIKPTLNKVFSLPTSNTGVGCFHKEGTKKYFFKIKPKI